MQYYPISQSGRFDIEPIPLQSLEVGDTVSLDLNGFLTAGAPSVAWTLDGGSLPPGLSMSSAGILSGTVSGFGGAYVVQVRADAGAFGVAAQGVAFSIPQQGGGGGGGGEDGWAAGTGGEVFEYVDADGVAWRAHRFTASDQFVVSRPGLLEVLLVAGGGGGGANSSNVPSGGGGGGGVVRRTLRVVSAGAEPITVGAGGSGAWGAGVTNGSDTSAFGLTALGGGAGAAQWTMKDGAAGGCGGGAIGAANFAGNEVGFGGSAIASIPGSEWCGQAGGSSAVHATIASRRAAGGGGFSQRGSASAGGGDGYYCTFFGFPAWYAGGGGGGCGQNITALPGGQGGGGNGGRGTATASSGVQNSGGGGGGFGTSSSTSVVGGSGGSGVAGVRYRV